MVEKNMNKKLLITLLFSINIRAMEVTLQKPEYIDSDCENEFKEVKQPENDTLFENDWTLSKEDNQLMQTFSRVNEIIKMRNIELGDDKIKNPFSIKYLKKQGCTKEEIKLLKNYSAMVGYL